MDAKSFLADRGDEGAINEREKRIVGQAVLGKKRFSRHGHPIQTGHFHDLPLRLSELAIDGFLDEMIHVPLNLGGPRRAGRRSDELKKQRMASDGPAGFREPLATRLPGKDLCDVGWTEATEFDFFDHASKHHVTSVIEWDGPTRQA